MAEQEFVVEREEDDFGGRYFIRLAADAQGEMTYRKTGSKVITIDHTFTPPAFRGRDVALSLVNRMIADVRGEGTKVVPLCSYVMAQFRRHPDWADLLAD
ncbi:MAG: GNAT family N-acetyltransferase [Devosia sp.]|nr:GNAT family N-acetyltransferase [Devosia sp.]